MSLFTKGLVAAMEDETVQEAELAIDETGADSAEADLVEATDISADVEAGVAEVEQAQADAETLTRIADTAEAAEAEGGLDPVAAEVAEIAVESIYARLGVKRSEKYPALESFSGKTGRKRATQVAVEDIKETVGKIFMAVIKALQQLIDTVVNFFGKLTDANKKYLARANGLLKQANAAKGEASGNVKAGGILKKTAAADKAGVLASVKAASGDFEKFMAVSETVSADCVGFTDAVKGLFSKSEKVGEAKAKALEVSAVAAEKIEKGYAAAGSFKERVVIEVHKSGKEQIFDVVSSAAKAIPGMDKEEVEALTVAETKDVLNAATAVLKSVIGKEASIAKIKAQSAKAMADAKAIGQSAAAGEDQAGVKLDAEAAARVINAYNKAIVKFVSIAGKLATDTATGAIEYAERSLATVKETKAA